jgi:elongation factor P--beta-lysine ligase
MIFGGVVNQDLGLAKKNQKRYRQIFRFSDLIPPENPEWEQFIRKVIDEKIEPKLQKKRDYARSRYITKTK